MIGWNGTLIVLGFAAWLGPVAVSPATRSDDEPANKNVASPDRSQQSLWSLQPVVVSPFPAVMRGGWSESEIDLYILSKLESNGIEPAPAADKRTLIRRATFDLIGLPPTPDEIHAFLADDSPDAFARVVDRLLASPHYGERWGRHWLDVARYADSNGMDENLAYANAFRYRDYVVAAFNKDKPYSQFVREQLAGDLLSRPSEHGSARSSPTRAPDSLIATGFLSLGPKMLAEDDPVKMEMDIIDEQVDTLGRTFLGLTLGCARCHDHKFDPLRMEDYYALAGIFKSTATMDNFKVVARWHEQALGTDDELAQQESMQREIAARKTEIARITTQANEALLHAARRRIADYLIAARDALEYETLQRDLPSLAEGSTVPGTIFLEAENFVRGNVKKEFAGYGEGIGVIYNNGELPNVAEYDVELPGADTYQFEVRYAAAESRPVRLVVNGQIVKGDVASKVTGSWFPDTQGWCVEGVFALAAGSNTIRLERPGAFPHFDKLALVPRKLPGRWKNGTVSPVEQLAEARGLNRELLRQWCRYLEQTKGDPNSVLLAWHTLTSTPVMPDADELFTELERVTVQALAARYQYLFDQADQAWQEHKSRPDGKEAKQLPDPTQESLRKVLYDPKGPFALPAQPEQYYPEAAASELQRVREQVAALEKSFVTLPDAMAVHEGTPQDIAVHIRGNYLTLGEQVPRGFPRVIANEQTPIDEKQSGRLQLADWLTRPAHPLTSRVMVNRIWRWHFGEGLVRSTDNFGQLGDRPSHPELLDWLAQRFVENGWSLKSMHRLIMLSATYQMSTKYNAQAAQVDPENRLYWRMSRRRLEAESIRDAILATAGTLDTTMGGSLLDGANRTYVKGYPNSNYDKYDFNRRSVYLPVLRSMLYDVFQAFDFADPSTPNGERTSTTVAPQALFALNSKLIGEQSKALAMELLSDDASDDRHRIERAYERALGRLPSEVEASRALDFLDRYEAALRSQNGESDDTRLRAWQAFCRTILASSEFIHLD